MSSYIAYKDAQHGWQVRTESGVSSFACETKGSAMRLCNYLNGGTGMSKRDQFALSAMNSLLDLAESSDQFNPEKVAESSYKFADAMLIQRRKK